MAMTDIYSDFIVIQDFGFFAYLYVNYYLKIILFSAISQFVRKD